MNIVDMAYQIIDMHEELAELRAENTRLRGYKKKYDDLLNESVQHGEQMMRNTLDMLVTPGVCEALAEKGAQS